MAPLPATAKINPPHPLVGAIYAAYAERQRDELRGHIGASQIGNPCKRAIWYSWRWVSSGVVNGRILRLFDTGKREEERMIADLSAVGLLRVYDIDPKTKKQWEVRDESGHFGGSMDGKVIGLPDAPDTWHVLECKTHNAKSFGALVASGVQISKPAHYAQVQSYAHLSGIPWALYMAVNKNTDEIYIEIVAYSPPEGYRLMAKARAVIDAPQPPSRISDDPSWFECKVCDHRATCHAKAPPRKHCRSCVHAKPLTAPGSNGAWFCDKHKDEIPLDFQPKGCEAHEFIPALTPKGSSK